MFKLIGPALIRQDLVEAKANVSKRLEFIGGELARMLQQQRAPQEKLRRAQEQARAAPAVHFALEPAFQLREQPSTFNGLLKLWQGLASFITSIYAGALLGWKPAACFQTNVWPLQHSMSSEAEASEYMQMAKLQQEAQRIQASAQASKADKGLEEA